MLCTALLLASSLASAAPAGDLLPDETPIHLGFSLAVTHPVELAALQRAQQDPASPEYHHWLTPADYGARFGQPAATYAAFGAWLRAAGFQVTESPNRTFIEGLGTSAQATKLLGVHLRHVSGAPPGVHVPDRDPRYPKAFAALIVHVAGLDTRIRHRHRLSESGGAPPALGPQDLRNFYDLAPLLDAGYVGQGQQLVVLGEAEPPATAISSQAVSYFLSNISDARAQVIYDVLPNPQQDLDPGGGNEEFQPDIELQSVGAPGAESITLVESPASEVFTTGANEIANNLRSATAVSISLGTCEPAEAQNSGEAAGLEALVVQGTLEGQTWSAATGDNGVDDCQDGQTVAVDFPASLPEIVAMGGAQISNPVFDANQAVTAYQQEAVWNGGNQGGAGGGGLSSQYATPSYQAGLGVAMRSVPDLSLLAGNPGVASDSSNPFIQLPLAGQLTTFEGTSASSPMSAGFFALIASRIGCRLGDPHAALYAMGRNQFDGGPIVFHDITQGNVSADGLTGASAAVGYDSASGWGSFDVAAMAAAWPKCPADGGFDFDGGIAAEGSYSQCAFIACDAGVDCSTLPEGPSSCLLPCRAGSPCAPGSLCTSETLFSANGLCVPGCATDADCAATPGTVCNACEETCVAPGNPDGGVGQMCGGPSDCFSASLCFQQDMFGNQWPDGYCTTFCDPTGALTACGCPGGSYCLPSMAMCVTPCTTPGASCRSDGYVCQPDGDGTSSCQPPCTVQSFGGQTFDPCSFISMTINYACDVASGTCLPPDAGSPPVPDAGPDAGTDAGIDAGPADAGQIAPDAGVDAGQPRPDAGSSPDAGTTPPPATGCGCSSAVGPSELSLLLGAVLALRRRRRR